MVCFSFVLPFISVLWRTLFSKQLLSSAEVFSSTISHCFIICRKSGHLHKTLCYTFLVLFFFFAA
uniref:Predicted protein n=1 Tax=Hordeum vulgare subsp. vulgare TaxID=112509 RepID=F2DF84_HORVV|nr:predicted protein [Hordeum vulgare subsp. vulgare]